MYWPYGLDSMHKCNHCRGYRYELLFAALKFINILADLKSKDAYLWLYVHCRYWRYKEMQRAFKKSFMTFV